MECKLIYESCSSNVFSYINVEQVDTVKEKYNNDLITELYLFLEKKMFVVF